MVTGWLFVAHIDLAIVTNTKYNWRQGIISPGAGSGRYTCYTYSTQRRVAEHL